MLSFLVAAVNSGQDEGESDLAFPAKSCWKSPSSICMLGRELQGKPRVELATARM